jgi:hypothetical protein
MSPWPSTTRCAPLEDPPTKVQNWSKIPTHQPSLADFPNLKIVGDGEVEWWEKIEYLRVAFFGQTGALTACLLNLVLGDFVFALEELESELADPFYFAQAIEVGGCCTAAAEPVDKKYGGVNEQMYTARGWQSPGGKGKGEWAWQGCSPAQGRAWQSNQVQKEGSTAAPSPPRTVQAAADCPSLCTTSQIDAEITKSEGMARTLLKKGNKERALLLMKRKKFYEKQWETADGELTNVKQLVRQHGGF